MVKSNRALTYFLAQFKFAPKIISRVFRSEEEGLMVRCDRGVVGSRVLRGEAALVLSPMRSLTR